MSGLKRKKSGFMPPRMVKQAFVENSQESQSGSERCIGFPQSGPSNNSYQNENPRRVPLLPQQTQNMNHADVSTTDKSPENDNSFQKYPAESIGKNLYNLYSRYNQHESDSASENSSQESSYTGGNKRLLSPWSVYGSKNSSPSLHVGIRHEPITKSPHFGPQTSVLVEKKGAGKSFDRSVNNPVESERSNVSDYSQCEVTTSWSVFSSKSVLPQNTNETFSAEMDEEKSKETDNQLASQSKRNITQIMKLLKKKPSPDDNLQDSCTNSVKHDKSSALCNSISKSTTEKFSKSPRDFASPYADQGMLESNGTSCKDRPYKNEIKDNIYDTEIAVNTCGTFPDTDQVRCNSDIRSTKEDLDMLEKSEENSDDEDLIGSFHINFSPLSHVTGSDDDSEITSSIGKDTTDSKHKSISLQNEKCVIESAITKNDAVDSVSNTACKTKQSTGTNQSHDSIPCKTNTSEEIPDFNRKESNSVNSGKLDNPNIDQRTDVEDCLESSEVDLQKVRCGESMFESGKDVIQNSDGEFCETNEQFDIDHEKLNASASRRTAENHCTPEIREEEINDETHINSFGENTLLKNCMSRSEISDIHDCNNDIKGKVDSFKIDYKEPEEGDLLDNEVANEDARQQLLDKNDVEGTNKTADKETEIDDFSGNEEATYIDTEQAVDNNESQYSRTTSMSQDTMDFSCDTMEDDSQNFGIHTQQLDRLEPSTCASKNRNFQYKLNSSKDIKNDKRYINSVNTGRQCENETVNKNTAIRSLNVDKNPTALSHASNASSYQISQFLDKRKTVMDVIHLTAQPLCPDSEKLDSEDPFVNLHDIPGTVPPHTNILKQGHAREKTQIDCRLGSYCTQGVSSAVVMRMHHNHPENRKASSPYKTAFHTASDSPTEDQVYNKHQSPFQQLSDSDLSKQSSPSFYIDWQNSKPQICKADKVFEDESSTVFSQDYNDFTNQDTQCSMKRPASQNIDEEEIYSKLYKPRLMYQHDNQNQFHYSENEHSNTCKSSRESSPVSMPETLTQFDRCMNSADIRHGGISTSLDSLPDQNFQAYRNISRACGSMMRQPYFTEPSNFHSQFSQSSDEYFLHGQEKSPESSLEPARERIRSEIIDDISQQTPESDREYDSLNSKWQNFVASQTSDDCDIDMNKLTKTVENTRKLRKDFVTLKSSPGLYNTQRVCFQSAVETRNDQKIVSESVITGLDSLQTDIGSGNSLSNGNVLNTSSTQPDETKSREFIQNDNNTAIQTVQRIKIDESKAFDDKVNKDCIVNEKYVNNFDSDMFSSVDSFEDLLADSNFEIEELKENVKSKTRETEQQVPEVEMTESVDTIVTGGDSNLKENSDILATAENGISLDQYSSIAEVTGSANVESSVKVNLNDCKRMKIGLENEALVPSDNEFSAEFESVDVDSGMLNRKLEDSQKLDEVSETGVKHLEQTSNGALTRNDKEDVNQKEESPLFISESMSGSLGFDRNKDVDVTVGTKTGKNENDLVSFSLDESLDLSFSFDSNILCATQSDQHTRNTHTMRIGWKPPIKSGSHLQSTTGNETKPQQKEAKISEKVKPTFKCLRLLAQTKEKSHPENGINLKNKNDKESKTMSPYLESDSGSVQQKWKFKSPKQSPDLHYNVKQSFNPGEKNLIPNLGRKDCKETTEDEICNLKRFQEGKLPNITSNKSFKPPSLTRTPIVNRTISSPCVPRRHTVDRKVPDQQGPGVSQTEFRFPSRSETERLQTVLRQVIIPETFPSATVYKQVLTAALTEYVNTQLFDVAKRYHHALSKVDTSGYSEYKSKNSRGCVNNPNPQCQCGVPSKMICVKKEGANCGRYFYACSANRKQQCKFFQWADEMRKGGVMSGSKRKIQDTQSLRMYMKDQHVHFYGECQLIKRTKENINKYFKAPKWARNRGNGDMVQKKQIFLKLPYKGRSSVYAKDDIWVISKHLDFDPLQSFLARSTYYGPSSSLEVEIEPLTGYSPSNWQHEDVCHGILAGNVSTELSCLDNIREYIEAWMPPILPHLLNRQNVDTEQVRNSSRGFQAPKVLGDQCNQSGRNIHIHSEQIDDLSSQYIERYRLNTDQAEALRRVANMFSIEKSSVVDSILLIHGVFGAGKSFLLSIMVLFLVEVFQLNDSQSPGQPFPWKLLISSTTNVAVDRILIGLLDLGFEDFVRVGSVKKIAKPVLPFSVHASGTDNQELKDLQEMLRSGDLTAAEKSHVRQSIEKHRLGENKKKLGKVRVVGATCASCSLTCLNNMEFPLVLLDECSQMTEPASLLPVAKFGCQKLLLVGDPKQLDPTIQGADAAHQNGLEQTMFDRLIRMGSVPTLLRTQYRCHPNISAVANKLFYGGMLEDGISEADRKPLKYCQQYVTLM
ncbi:uncharacterized protein LOC123563456 isoform X2 [Mercenaria mercenaria]|uniref:uncharacterized protein LOC123563456 isoform X2 n=1 Tax=Mercenaria mercenaria TaxID=6596 RepID=UPI00234F714A|nr:uncharacterized protein LOC123563456 isoform X2 [Mercenaria mercenaria]